MMANKKYTKPSNMNQLAHRIAELGYHPVPIQVGMKGPTFSGWPQYDATPENIDRDFPKQNIVIGCKHDNLGCVDIDVYDAELSKILRDEFLSRFPKALERIGEKPKTAMVFRLPEIPYTVTNTGNYKKDGVEAHVEVRTKSGQMVVYGKHPKTMKPYTWPLGELWETPIENLPMPGEWEIEEYRDWAEQKIKEWAGVNEPSSAMLIDLGAYTGFSNEPPTEEAVREALSYIPPDMCHDDWRDVLFGLHDYYNGSQHGLMVAKEWSSPYKKYDPKQVEAKWKSFTKGGITYSTIFHFAKSYGADLSEIARKHRKDPIKERMKESLLDRVSMPENVTHVAEVADVASTQWPTPVPKLNQLELPRRKWVYGTAYIREFVTVTASAGGIGKTSLATVEALAIATGKPLLGEAVREQTNVWVLNLEDPLMEMNLRLAAAMEKYKIGYDEIDGKLFMDAEDTMEMILAAEGRDGLIKNDALLEFMTKRIKQLKIGCVIIDPFVSTHLVNENSNASIQAVVSMLRKLARDTGAAIHLIHHVRKGNGEDATIDSVRGAGALIGAARAARVINKVSEEEALSLGVNQDEAKGIFRVDDGKANLAPPAEKAVYRRMVGVELANGEWVGVAIEFKLPDVFEGITAKDTRKVQDIVGGAMQNKKPYRQNIQAADWVGHAVGDVLGIDTHTDQGKGRVKRIVKTWIANDVLRMDKIEDERKKREVPIVVVGQWVNWDEM